MIHGKKLCRHFYILLAKVESKKTPPKKPEVSWRSLEKIKPKIFKGIKFWFRTSKPMWHRRCGHLLA
jgi:hypothetical protein